MLSEDNIIRHIKDHFPEHIGHDTAAIDIPIDSSCVVTKDLLLENIHFHRDYVEPKSLAYKALCANLSDLAASGAQPKYLLLGLSIPKHDETYDGSYLDAFINHFINLCKTEQLSIIGGDTTASQSGLVISITAIGYAKKNQRKTRHGAQRNDLICITGPTGETHLGLTALENRIDHLDTYKNKFLFPKAKTREGRWLAKQHAVTSMMDISDGLHIDLKRLCKASNCGAIIELNSADLCKRFVTACSALELGPIQTILTGGEDFELLFTCQHSAFDHLCYQFKKAFNYSLNMVGHICKDKSIAIIKDGKQININTKPFTHFGEPT